MARIMVVEDDVYMREELTDLLRKSGYETASLFDFENAIPEITEYSPDLVLLDINLPFHSGFEICKELKAKQLGTVLVLTARDKLQDELHALGLGAYTPASVCPLPEGCGRYFLCCRRARKECPSFGDGAFQGPFCRPALVDL